MCCCCGPENLRGLWLLREGLPMPGDQDRSGRRCTDSRGGMRGLRQMRPRVPGKRYRAPRGAGMKKHWYDYLWIASLLYLLLGFFNILFAWLGLLCFFIPLVFSVARGSKGYCNRYCGTVYPNSY